MFFTDSYEQERVFDLLLFALMAAMLYAAYWKAMYQQLRKSQQLKKRAEDNRAASKARGPRGR